ncbi:Rfx1 protein [Saccharomycopsis crataegensis]|uniref:Rfx1 protein n=1 Tax=Saccharomycopsis crataegensis TaxID=43959 RepID=A0AAV5QF87_9ASCO|nr:Rfx1 protein [Saccharomycopsis crataegensis]
MSNNSHNNNINNDYTPVSHTILPEQKHQFLVNVPQMCVIGNNNNNTYQFPHQQNIHFPGYVLQPSPPNFLNVANQQQQQQLVMNTANNPLNRNGKPNFNNPYDNQQLHINGNPPVKPAASFEESNSLPQLVSQVKDQSTPVSSSGDVVSSDLRSLDNGPVISSSVKENPKPDTRIMQVPSKPINLNGTTTMLPSSVQQPENGPMLKEQAAKPTGSTKIPIKAAAVDSKDKKKKTANSKPLTQSDIDLKLLSNNIDDFKNLRELAGLIRQIEATEQVVGKNGKSNPNNTNPTDNASLDPLAKIDRVQFQNKLATLPKSKKLQLFGIAWLKKACKVAPEGHIPRNRIFAKYVTVCADHGVASLSPALFGKLIRMIYPCITIHRYGVRGQSKYHYCGITLLDNTPIGPASTAIFGGIATPNNGSIVIPTSGSSTPVHHFAHHHHNSVIGSELSNSEVSSPLRSVFDIDSSVNSPIYSATELSPVSSTSYANNNNSVGNPTDTKNIPQLSLSLPVQNAVNVNKYLGNFPIKFFPDLFPSLEAFSENDISSFILTLPPIDPYIPRNFNSDIATTLQSLYKSHCTAIFESVRYMKVKDLGKTLGSFPRSLTNPVFKLYISEPILPWLLKCDFVLFQSILKMLFKLFVKHSSDEASAQHVLNQLREIANNYSALLSESLINLPQKMVMSKVNVARKFGKLMGKIVDVCDFGWKNRKTFAMVKEVSSQKQIPESEILHDAWIKNVNTEKLINESSPLALLAGTNTFVCANLIKVFNQDIPHLIHNSKTSSIPMERIISTWLSYFAQLACHVSKSPSNPDNSNRISPELFLLTFNCLFDSALKAISRSRPTEFQALWNIKCWVCEWLDWYGELGGFLSIHGEKFFINNQDLPPDSIKQPNLMSASTSNSTTPVNAGAIRPSVGSNIEGSKKRFRTVSDVFDDDSFANSLNNMTDSSVNSFNSAETSTIAHANTENSIIMNNRVGSNNSNHQENNVTVNSAITQNETLPISVSPRKRIKLLSIDARNTINDDAVTEGKNNNVLMDQPVDLLGGYLGPEEEKELMSFLS